MPLPSSISWQRAVVTTAGLISVTLVMVILYWGRIVLVPFALAILITFLLAPLVTRVERWGLPRIPAVVFVTLLSGLLLAGLMIFITLELSRLTADLPRYRTNILAKIESIRSATNGDVIRQLQSIVEEVAGKLEPAEEPSDGSLKRRVEPIPVEIYRGDRWPLGIVLFQAASPILAPLALAGFIFVLVIFMLIDREDLRNRAVSVAGQGHLAVTTKALDDAAQRISRYLLMQMIINISFGLAAGIGLLLIGVPYAFLWGLSATVLRYIPYVGPWVAALLAVGIALVTFSGWSQVLLVAALFIALELVSNNILEPWLFGQSVGVTPVALLISAVLWAWLWGPIGLVLSTPLTVLLVVFSKHFPHLSLIDRLLGDAPALEPPSAYYQRLLAGDDEEALAIVEKLYQEETVVQAMDRVLIPALVMAKQDRVHNRISEADEEAFLTSTQEIIDRLGWVYGSAAESLPVEGSEEKTVTVVGCPSRDRMDEQALQIFGKLLTGLPNDSRACDFRVLSAQLLASERLSALVQENPAIVLVASLSSGDLAHIRYLCLRLRSRLPNSKILVGRWGHSKADSHQQEALRIEGANEIATSLSESLTQLQRHLQIAQNDIRLSVESNDTAALVSSHPSHT